MKVELLAYTSSRELMAALPVSEVPVNEFLGHLSFTFSIEGISRACSHQLVRHRVASFSQQSQRYIQVKRLQEHTVTPPTITDVAKEKFDSYIDEASETYTELVDKGVP